MAMILTNSNATGATDGFLRCTNDYAIWCQSFQITGFSKALVSSARFRLKEVGTISDAKVMWCEIHSSQTGTSLTKNASTNIVGTASDEVSTSTLSSSYQYVDFTFSGTQPSLNINTTYYLMLYSDLTISATNYIAPNIGLQIYSGTGIMYYIDTNLAWHTATNFDNVFYVYGSVLLTDGVAASDTLSGTFSISDTFTESVSASDTGVKSAQSIATNYSYYLLSNDGKVYTYDPAYKSDAGTALVVQYITKNTDLTDQGASPSDIFKIVYIAKLFYLDLDANTNVTLYISTDDGTTWSTSPTATKSIGTGSGEVKTVSWYFPGGVMGQFFKFKIVSGSTSTRAQWLGLEIEYDEGGPHFNIT